MDNVWCVGWQNGGMQSKDGKELTLLGAPLITNKLIDLMDNGICICIKGGEGKKKEELSD
ncbi:unnamed protein product [Camellia sinensis]